MDIGDFCGYGWFVTNVSLAFVHLSWIVINVLCMNTNFKFGALVLRALNTDLMHVMDCGLYSLCFGFRGLTKFGA